MSLSAYVFYLGSKYKHEIIRDIYQTDMLRFAAFGMVEEKDRPPRYWDVLHDQKSRNEPTKAKAATEHYDEQDIVNMFRGGK